MINEIQNLKDTNEQILVKIKKLEMEKQLLFDKYNENNNLISNLISEHNEYVKKILNNNFICVNESQVIVNECLPIDYEMVINDIKQFKNKYNNFKLISLKRKSNYVVKNSNYICAYMSRDGILYFKTIYPSLFS